GGSPASARPARMRRVKRDSTIESQRPARRVEALLHAAADYEPTRAAPEGLAARAMASCQAAPARHPRAARRANLLSGILVAVAGCAAWGLAAHRTVPTPSPAAGPVAGQVSPAVLAGVLERPEPRPSGLPGTEQLSPPRRLRLASRAAFRRRLHAAAGAALHRAYWEVETIDRETTHLLAPAWRVERHEELGGWIVTPGTVDVVLPARGDPGVGQDSPAPATGSPPATTNTTEERTDEDCRRAGRQDRTPVHGPRPAARRRRKAAGAGAGGACAGQPGRISTGSPGGESAGRSGARPGCDRGAGPVCARPGRRPPGMGA